MQKVALYPDLVSPTSLVVGAIVKHLPYGSNQSTEMTGVVTHIIPSTSKVYVSWPHYGNTQHDASELLVITQGHGVESPIVFSTGYTSWEKRKSERLYGKVTPHGVVRVASVILDEEHQKVARIYAKAASYQMIGYSKSAAITMLAALSPDQNPTLVSAAVNQAWADASDLSTIDSIGDSDDMGQATIDNEPTTPTDDGSGPATIENFDTAPSVGEPTTEQ